ncbi:MAG: hypothetical protein ACTSYI_07645 [Promethearchaeota archaeon]
MKKSTKSLFSITMLAIFVFSMVGQIIVSDFGPSANNLQESSLDSFPISAYDSNYGVQPLELNSDQLNDLGIIEIFEFTVRDTIGVENFNQSENTYIDYYDHDVIDKNPWFDSTLIAADSEHASGNPTARNAVITIILNETVKWNYSSDAVSYVYGFSPYVQPATLYELYMNGSVVDSSNYTETTELLTGNTWFNYNFTHLFENASEGEFELLYQYTVDIPISAWRVTTLNLLLDEEEDEEPIGPYYYLNGNETIIPMGYEYNITFGNSNWNYNVSARYQITLPSPSSIHDLELVSYTNQEVDQLPITIENNTVSLNFWTYLDNLDRFGMRFKANFTVEMLDLVDNEFLWCEDRMVDFPRERERDYKLSITDGPENLAVSFFAINETGIYYDDLLENTQIESAIGRTITIGDMNTSTGDPSGTIISGNTTLDYVDGVSFLTITTENNPYVLFRGEVDIITIYYQAVRDLQLTIADNTKTPIVGIRANIYLGNQLYGSKMSAFRNFPLSTRISDINGQIEVICVPRGDYVIEIFDAQGQPLQNLTASSLSDYKGNLLVTSIPHVPVVILSFTGICSVLVVGGILIYKKKK